MMSHSNGYVLAIKDQNRKVLREIAGKVYLPFHSEYSLLIKNNNPFRACCSVRIDGTDVMGTELILNAFSSTDLERFLVNGDMQQGNRFKFVPLSDGRVQDPSSPENGLIEVKFWKEIQRPIYLNYPIIETWPKSYQPTIYSTPSGWTSACNNLTYTCSAMRDMGDLKCANTASQAGATVEGSVSHQSFTTTSFEGKDGEATVIRLQLMSRTEPITVEKTKHIYCVECGKSNPYNNKFCGRCGTRLQK
jgi:hypothetical protein